jgi:hypothetical protein
LPFNNYNYSYVSVATDKYKYSTLSFNRLGIGNSTHGEPLNEIQIFLEIAATAQLTQMLRNGTFPELITLSARSYTSDTPSGLLKHMLWPA